MQLWLYLHFPTLQLDRLFHGRDHQQAIVIVDGKKHCIRQLNADAQQSGITVNMGLGSAAALCAELQLHPYDPKVEEKALNDIASQLYQVSADIALCPPQGILLKVTDMLSLYQGIENYWQAVSKTLDSLELHYHFATGFSPFSAMLLAKAAFDHIDTNRETLTKAICEHSINASELTDKHLMALHRVGINSMQKLLSLNLADLARRFDIDVVNYLGRLTGQLRHPLTLFTPPEHFTSQLDLLHDIDNVQWLAKPLHRLLDRLELFLRLRDRVSYELTLTLQLRDGQPHSLTFSSAAGEDKSSRWQTLAGLHMESLRLEHPVQSLTLYAKRTGEKLAVNQEMWSGKTTQYSELELISLLQAKLGSESVHKVALSGDPRPESATSAYDPTTKSDAPSQLKRCRPSLLLPEPEALAEPVHILRGPERITTGWWDGGGICRDYFIARSDAGQWLWIFRTPKQEWFVHGYFS